MIKTRFQKEISGDLGEYWIKSAEREVKEAVEWAERDAIVEADGAIRWRESGNYLFDDFCEKLEYAGFAFSRAATAQRRKEQVERELAEYRAHPPKISNEEIYEMRAAFGAGETVIDIITGQKICL